MAPARIPLLALAALLASLAGCASSSTAPPEPAPEAARPSQPAPGTGASLPAAPSPPAAAPVPLLWDGRYTGPDSQACVAGQCAYAGFGWLSTAHGFALGAPAAWTVDANLTWSGTDVLLRATMTAWRHCGPECSERIGAPLEVQGASPLRLQGDFTMGVADTLSVTVAAGRVGAGDTWVALTPGGQDFRLDGWARPAA